MRLCVGRRPTAEEAGSVEAFYARQLERFRVGELKAEAVAVSEAFPKPKSGDLDELAAWTAVARGLLNLDETVTKE